VPTPPERPPQDNAERDDRGLLGPATEFQRNLTKSAPYVAASYTLIGGIVLLGGLGYFADGRLGTSPWLLLLGLLMGILVGFYELIRVVWGRGK
jgi:F0F1-type ATP synthase assembly protein I